MKKTVKFRLTEGRTPASWSISGGFAVKEGKGRKLINYYPGSDSYFDEDNEKSDVKPQEVVFTYNDILSDPATEIEVSVDDKALIGYLKAHPFYGLHYKIHDEDMIFEDKIAVSDKVEKALELIKETDDLKIQAMALVVFKIDAHGWSAIKAKAELKEKAIKNPDVIIAAIEADNYQSKYLAALAFYSGIITENNTHTAVIWNDDNQNEILKLAVGENGIQKLGDKLSVSNEESTLILQQIGTKLNALKSTEASTTTAGPVKSEAQIRAELLAEVKAEALEEARAELAAQNTGNTAAGTDSASGANPEAGAGKTGSEYDPTDLAQVQAKYKEVTGNDAPPRFKGDIDWLTAKITEKGA